MNRSLLSILAVIALAVVTSVTFAQREGDRGPRNGERGPRDTQHGPRDGVRGPHGPHDGRGPHPGGPPPNPIVEALDNNRDGEISSDEISDAVAALKKLDRNSDGKLTHDELRPPHRPRGMRDGVRGPRDDARPPRGDDRPPKEGDRPERPARPESE